LADELYRLAEPVEIFLTSVFDVFDLKRTAIKNSTGHFGFYSKTQFEPVVIGQKVSKNANYDGL